MHGRSGCVKTLVVGVFFGGVRWTWPPAFLSLRPGECGLLSAVPRAMWRCDGNVASGPWEACWLPGNRIRYGIDAYVPRGGSVSSSRVNDSAELCRCRSITLTATGTIIMYIRATPYYYRQYHTSQAVARNITNLAVTFMPRDITLPPVLLPAPALIAVPLELGFQRGFIDIRYLGR